MTPVNASTPSQADRFRGCLLGGAMGDALGAPYEGGIAEKLLWRLIGKTKQGLWRWTDDTQMTLDICEVLLKYQFLDSDRLALQFSKSFAWSRGYGPGTTKVLKKMKRGTAWRTAAQDVYPNGSWGNGAAMRVAPIALLHHQNIQNLLIDTRQSAVITHAHPLAQEGACLVALAIHAALSHVSTSDTLSILLKNVAAPALKEKLVTANQWVCSAKAFNAKAVASSLGNDVSAQGSCITAIYIGLTYIHKPFEQLIQACISCGGDVDTIAAMAGNIWGAANGAKKLPSIPLEQQAYIEACADQLLILAQQITAQTYPQGPEQ